MKDIFKKQVITKEEIVDFWTINTSDREVKIHNNKSYRISKKNNELLIFAKDDNIILNPERDFIQARIDLDSNTQKIIIVEAKKFIERLYLGLPIGGVLFCFMILVKESFLISLIPLAIYSLIFNHNYRKINKAIVTFKNELEFNKDQSKVTFM